MNFNVESCWIKEDLYQPEGGREEFPSKRIINILKMTIKYESFWIERSHTLSMVKALTHEF